MSQQFDRHEQLRQVEYELAAELRWRTTLMALEESLRRRLQALDPRESAEATKAFYDVQESLRQLHDGVDRHDGMVLDVMTALVGKPGLRATERTITRLETERERLRDSIARWPEPTTTHPYRYVGPPFAAFVNGRGLAPGDVVALTESQATAWVDRFEAVAEEQVG